MSLSQQDATSAYLALDEKGKEKVARRASLVIPCMLCGAKEGETCHIALYAHAYGRVLDGFAHANRWMKYMQDPELWEMLAPPDISDML